MSRLWATIRLLGISAALGVTLALFGRAVGYASPWFALIAMFDFLGVIAFGRSLFVISRAQLKVRGARDLLLYEKMYIWGWRFHWFIKNGSGTVEP